MTKLAAAALLLCPPAFASPKPRTLKDLVKLALKTGADDEIASFNSEALGMGSVDKPTKNIWVEAEDAPDHRQHILDVVLGKTPTEADCLTFSAKTNSETQEGTYIDGVWLRISPDGKLLNAMSFEGRVGETYRTRLSLTDPKTKAVFERERDFWLKTSSGLPVKSQ